MNRIEFRPAARHEARAIAELYRISSEGVADYVWTGLRQPGEDLLDVGARRYAREGIDFSYQNVTLAVAGDDIAGMLAAYRMGPAQPPACEADVDPVLRPYSLLEQPDSLYISGMALYPRYRGHGIGTRLLELAAGRARSLRLTQLSLIVFGQNAGARRLYERRGFREIVRAPIVPHPLLHVDGEALLMVREV